MNIEWKLQVYVKISFATSKVNEMEELIKQILQEIPYHLQRMEFGAEIDGTEDFFQVKQTIDKVALRTSSETRPFKCPI